MTVSPNAWRNRARTLREIMNDVINRWEHPHPAAVPLIYSLRDTVKIDDATDMVGQLIILADDWEGPFADNLINELSDQLAAL
jgi:hypothetical protein